MLLLSKSIEASAAPPLRTQISLFLSTSTPCPISHTATDKSSGCKKQKLFSVRGKPRMVYCFGYNYLLMCFGGEWVTNAQIDLLCSLRPLSQLFLTSR